MKIIYHNLIKNSMSSKKGGLINRRKSALSRLEATYKKFVEARKDREEFRTNDGRLHSFKTYESERDRMFDEITSLKTKLHV